MGCSFGTGPFGRGSNGPILCPTMIIGRAVAASRVIGRLSGRDTCSTNYIIKILRRITSVIMSRLQRKGGIQLSNLNAFSLTLSSHRIASQGRVHTTSIEVGGIGFHPIPRLIGQIQRRASVLHTRFNFLPAIGGHDGRRH